MNKGRSSAKRYSRNQLQQLLVDIEPELEFCWTVLAPPVDAEDRGTKLLLHFQPKLMRVLVKLSDAYRDIKAEERSLVTAKGRLKDVWFRQRMKQLSGYRKTICQAISIARNLGNAFAWVFYHKEQALIRRHLAKQPQLLIPPGVGGIGERWLAENFLRTDRKLVLHHGITSFLRIGDISIVDPQTGTVDCIGEIKTERLSDTEASISLHLISGSREALPFTERVMKTKDTKAPPPTVQGRLERQVKVMGEAIKRVEKASFKDKLTRDGEFYLKHVEGLVAGANSRRFKSKKLGDGLLVAAVRLGKPHSLAQNLTRRSGQASGLVAGIEKEVVSIFNSGVADNALWIGFPRSESGYPQFHGAMTPVPLWSIDREAKRALVFEEVLLVSFYNPAHFHQRLHDIGYQLELGPKSQLKRATRRFAKHEQVLENSSYFYEVITKYFLSEDDVVRILEKTVELASTRGPNTRVDIELTLHM